MDYLANETLRRINRLSAAVAPLDPRFMDLARRVRLSRILMARADRRPVEGVDGEYLQERARLTGKPFDSDCLRLGWELFTRADTVAAGNAGGYLTETAVTSAADALRPTMVCSALGATFLDATGNLSLPRQTGIATAQWLTGETTVATETQQLLSNLGLSPHTVSTYSEVSRQLLLQSNMDFLIRRDILLGVANAADLAALCGTGIAGQPTGISQTQGIQTFSGGSATVGTFTSAFVALGDGLDDESGGVAANRAVAGLLRQRPETSGSTRTLWDGKLTNGTVIGYPARSSTALPSENVILGSWKYLVIATWGSGLELVVNPYGDGVTGTNNFRMGVVGYRCMLTMDSGAIYPSAFNFGAAVT